MPNIQISAERKRDFYEEHRLWLRDLPRAPGQIGGTIGTLVEGSPIYTPGEITPYSDFEPVQFIGVPQELVDHLRAKGFSFQEKGPMPGRSRCATTRG